MYLCVCGEGHQKDMVNAGCLAYLVLVDEEGILLFGRWNSNNRKN